MILFLKGVTKIHDEMQNLKADDFENVIFQNQKNIKIKTSWLL